MDVYTEFDTFSSRLVPYWQCRRRRRRRRRIISLPTSNRVDSALPVKNEKPHRKTTTIRCIRPIPVDEAGQVKIDGLLQWFPVEPGVRDLMLIVNHCSRLNINTYFLSRRLKVFFFLNQSD